MTYPGRVKNGVIVLEGNEKLPEGARWRCAWSQRTGVRARIGPRR